MGSLLQFATVPDTRLVYFMSRQGKKKNLIPVVPEENLNFFLIHLIWKGKEKVISILVFPKKEGNNYGNENMRQSKLS